MCHKNDKRVSRTRNHQHLLLSAELKTDCHLLDQRNCYELRDMLDFDWRSVCGMLLQVSKNWTATLSIQEARNGHHPSKNATWPPRAVTARTVFWLHSCRHDTVFSTDCLVVPPAMYQSLRRACGGICSQDFFSLSANI